MLERTAFTALLSSVARLNSFSSSSAGEQLDSEELHLPSELALVLFSRVLLS